MKIQTWLKMVLAATLVLVLVAIAVCVSVSAALVSAGATASSLGVVTFGRFYLRDREANLQGRTANRLIMLFWQARRRLGRPWRQQPLYLVMGPHGVGKTSLLAAAGLGISDVIEATDAPESQARLVSSGGMSFLEVPSRLFDNGQGPAWRAFLTTLRWLGAARRIKGVLWVLDVSAMGAGSPPPMWRDAMAALVHRLGVRPPTYVVLNRCDAIPGFTDAFERAAPSTVEGPWGFAIDDSDETALVGGHRFDTLLDTLRGYVMAHLSQKDSRLARAPLYLFPQYVSTLRRGLMHCIESTFGTQAKATGPRMGGLYFVATPPAPMPADVVAAAPADAHLQQILGLSVDALSHDAPASLPTPWQPESLTLSNALAPAAMDLALDHAPLAAAAVPGYFVRGLFADVLAHDRALDSTVKRGGFWGELTRAPMRLALSVCVLAFILLALTSFAASMARIKTLSQAVAVPWGQQEAEERHAILPLMRAIEQHDSNFWARTGEALGFGDSAARAPVASLYVRLLQRDLMAPLLVADGLALHNAWRRHAYAGSSPEQREATLCASQLRTHLLLTGPKAAHEPALDQRQSVWLTQALGMRLAAAQADGDDEAQDLMHRHLRLYVQLMHTYPELLMKRDEGLVSRARALLQRRPLADLLIDGLIYDVGLTEPSVRLDDIMTSGVVPMTGRAEVAAAFTKEGYSRHVKAWLRAQETGSDAWIFWEAQPKLAQRRDIVRQVRSRYYNRYIESWRDFIASLVWQAPSDAHSGHAMLVALTRSEPPPLRALWHTVAVNTQLEDDPAGIEADDSVFRGLRRRLMAQGTAYADDGQDGRKKHSDAGPEDVARAFAPLLAFGGATAQPDADREQKSPLGAYQDLLQELRGAVENYLEAPQETESLMQQLRRTRTQASGLIQSAETGSGARAVLQQLLIVPLEHMTRALTRGVRAQVVDVWCPSVVQPYAALAKFYPFNPTGPDASLDDVAAYFHPKLGQPWQFFEEYLSRDVLKKADGFVFDDKMGGVIRRTYKPSLLSYYGHLLAISKAMFAGGGADSISADFDMRLTMDKELWEIRLDVEGVSAHVAPGSSVTSWQRVHWPAKSATPPSATLLMVGVGGVKERLDFDGPWALWHLLESGQVRLDRITNTLTITWRPGGVLGHARLEIRPSRSNNPFFIGRAQSFAGGIFGYLRDGSQTPPRAIGVGQRACAL